MSFATQGKGPLFGTSSVAATPVTFTIYNQSNTSLGAGYVMPTVTGYNLTHNAEVARTKDGNGDIDAVTGHGEYIECQFDLLATGTSLANARLSATVPPVMSTVVIAGADVIACGPFADAVNSGSGSRWIYEGGGSVKFTADGHATLSLTLRRYPNITGGVAITD